MFAIAFVHALPYGFTFSTPAVNTEYGDTVRVYHGYFLQHLICIIGTAIIYKNKPGVCGMLQKSVEFSGVQPQGFIMTGYYNGESRHIQ